MFSFTKKFFSAFSDVKKVSLSQEKLSTIFYSAFLFFWVVRFFNDLWLFQQLAPPVFYTGHDLSFQILNNFEWVHAASKSFYFSLFVDVSLIMTAISCLQWKKNGWLNLIFSILLLIYIFIHYGSLGAHKHNLSGLWFTSLIFIWPSKNAFALAFKALRYFAIYAYASAGFWKIYRSCFNYEGFFSTILKSHNALYMHVHPESVKTKIVAFLIDHASLGDLLYQCMTIGELLFLVALFTTRFDKLLVYFAVSFHTVSYFLVNVYFYEYTLILLPLFFKLEVETGKIFFLNAWQTAKSLTLVCLFILSAQAYYFLHMHYLLKYQDFENTQFFGAYPIQNYMMYSYPYQADSFHDYQIYADGELVVQQSWVPIKTEQFEGNIMQYEKIEANQNIIEYNQRASDMYPKYFNTKYNQVDLQAYQDWIIKKTASLTNANPATIEIYHCEFQFEGSKSVLIKKERVF